MEELCPARYCVYCVKPVVTAICENSMDTVVRK
jgi:hypothetical protein